MDYANKVGAAKQNYEIGKEGWGPPGTWGALRGGGGGGGGLGVQNQILTRSSFDL